MRLCNHMIIRSSITAAVLVAMSGIATAATPSSEPELIEEVVVTAQKRAAALQDVPFAVAASSEQQIRDSGATNIVDLSRNFAGLTITDLGPGQSQVAMRGISAGQVVRDLVVEPELPAYELGNLRVGLRKQEWEARCSSTISGTSAHCCPWIASAGRVHASVI